MFFGCVTAHLHIYSFLFKFLCFVSAMLKFAIRPLTCCWQHIFLFKCFNLFYFVFVILKQIDFPALSEISIGNSHREVFRKKALLHLPSRTLSNAWGEFCFTVNLQAFACDFSKNKLFHEFFMGLVTQNI